MFISQLNCKKKKKILQTENELMFIHNSITLSKMSDSFWSKNEQWLYM